MTFEGIIPGEFRTPAIGREAEVQAAETGLRVDEAGAVFVQSPIWEDEYSIGDGGTFKDPRTDTFLKVLAHHQFHHFSTRQLSFVELFETRHGAARFVRLGHVLDSAKIINDLGGTFEQAVQTVISDLAHPAGSHQRGDFMMGDYENQDSHDADLWRYIVNSGFLAALEAENLVDKEGSLAGSPVPLQALADPRVPRTHDLAECPRPDNNSDRAQFTMHEGVLIHDQKEVQAIMKSMVRIETADGDRMALNDIDAARLLYILGVREESEDWNEPIRSVLEETALLADRYLFTNPNPAAEFRALQDWYPVDHARIDEQTWFDHVERLGTLDPFITNVLRIAASIAAHQREVTEQYTNEHERYTDPVPPPGMTIEPASRRVKTTLSVGHAEGGVRELWLALPQKKIRGGIDSPVVTKNGVKRVTELDPSLLKFADKRKRWAVPLLAKVALPEAIGDEVERGIRIIKQAWSTASSERTRPHPETRKPMPPEVLRHQIDLARARTIELAKVN